MVVENQMYLKQLDGLRVKHLAKALVSSMDDIIFNGTQNLPAKNFAVSIELDNFQESKFS